LTHFGIINNSNKKTLSSVNSRSVNEVTEQPGAPEAAWGALAAGGRWEDPLLIARADAIECKAREN
jgi:hypothetical protein